MHCLANCFFLLSSSFPLGPGYVKVLHEGVYLWFLCFHLFYVFKTSPLHFMLHFGIIMFVHMNFNTNLIVETNSFWFWVWNAQFCRCVLTKITWIHTTTHLTGRLKGSNRLLIVSTERSVSSPRGSEIEEMWTPCGNVFSFLWPLLRASGFGSYPELERQWQSELKADSGSGFLIQFLIVENSVGFCESVYRKESFRFVDWFVSGPFCRFL